MRVKRAALVTVAALLLLAGCGSGQPTRVVRVVVAVRPNGRGNLFVTNLAPAPQGKTYEAWVINGRRSVPRPAGLFDGGRGTALVRLAGEAFLRIESRSHAGARRWRQDADAAVGVAQGRLRCARLAGASAESTAAKGRLLSGVIPEHWPLKSAGCNRSRRRDELRARQREYELRATAASRANFERPAHPFC